MKRIIGMAVEKFSDSKFTGGNCEFVEKSFENTRYIFVFSDGRRLAVWQRAGICPSEWTTATWGEWKWLEEKRPFNYLPKNGEPIKVVIEEQKKFMLTITTEGGKKIVEVSYDAGDGYYPNGYVWVWLDGLFKPTARTMEGRPVWIFTGKSGLGKSTIGADIASGCSKKIVFETDSVDVLPEEIWADIIVAGKRKGGFSLEEIKKSLPAGVKPIVVEFKD